MRIGDRYELAMELMGRYARAGRAERGVILDGFCLATGYHRKYAIAMLRGRRRVVVHQRASRARRYGMKFQRALLVAWEASGYVCSERLQLLDDEAPAGAGFEGERCRAGEDALGEPSAERLSRRRHDPAALDLPGLGVDEVEGDLPAVHVEAAYDAHGDLLTLLNFSSARHRGA
jgi:hypothetical protein